MLVSTAALGDRRRLTAGTLAPLVDSLTADLAPLAAAREIYVPEGKARLTRGGGRCPRCGTTLDFDPWSPRRHHCSRCDVDLSGVDHDGMWVMWYQLWLAERSLHAAALFAVRGDPAHRELAEGILGAYAERYLGYPNEDNVLGPTRVFFSTYLEAIWTLQLACALDLLESADAGLLGGTVRDRILQPSATLIAQYDEGLSNRQVWNNAALLACAGLLGDAQLAQRAVVGHSGLLTHLEHALFADGTWYEGENYHLFAHRGLWYAVTLADAAGVEIPPELRRRYRRAFETPFLTALPDFTFPSRRDSQYRVSLRQWRIAESCELGLAEAPSPILAGALRELYRPDVPAAVIGRDRSTAEAERNVPASRLTRADLGWKSLLFAAEAPVVSASASSAIGSVLLPDQGYAVLRRDQGRTYVALDYGASGGGHGHPDRLNLWLVVGEARILEDVGTGSYVDPSLHWFRSTLAHNAPLADGQSQRRSDGELLAYDEHGDFGWTLARVVLAPNVAAERAVVVAPDYMIDELYWTGAPSTVLDVPYHMAGSAPSVAQWTDALVPGARGLEDGFRHVVDSAHSPAVRSAQIVAEADGITARVWICADTPFVLWRVRAPGPPNEELRDFFVVRATGASGRLHSVIDWTGAASDVQQTEAALIVVRRDGSRHAHARAANEWRVTAGQKQITLSGGASRPGRKTLVPPPGKVASVDRKLRRTKSVDPTPGAIAQGDAPALHFQLGRDNYRRSEQTWEEAGRPAATVAFAATSDELHVDIAVTKSPLVFAPSRSENPLDNEHPDINSDGVQLYVGDWRWLLVPEPHPPYVRITAPQEEGQPAPSVRASWSLTPSGYAVRIVAAIADVVDRQRAFLTDVIVNEMPAHRERRRGQLVLSGARGEWVYLRGDRQDRSRFLHVVITDA